MKLVKTASGKKTLKISKKEWQNIGKKQGWVKKAEGLDEKDPAIIELMKLMAPNPAALEPGASSCVFCKKEVKDEDFRDELSKKEWNISRLCQECQDKTFGSGE